MNFGGALEFIDMGDAKIDRPFLKGEYSENYIVYVGLNMNWKF